MGSSGPVITPATRGRCYTSVPAEEPRVDYKSPPGQCVLYPNTHHLCMRVSAYSLHPSSHSTDCDTHAGTHVFPDMLHHVKKKKQKSIFQQVCNAAPPVVCYITSHRK